MRYLVLGFLCLITTIAYLQRVALSAPTKIIEQELGLTPAGMGAVMGAWYWGYSLTQIPSGWVADRLGSKLALIVFALAWSILTALTSFANSFIGLVILWGLMGCAQAGIFPCATKAIGVTFPLELQAFASGALAAFMQMGAAIAQWLTAQLLATYAWQQILVLYAVPGLVWAIVFAFAIPRFEAPAAKAMRASAGPVRWSKLITDTQMQLICAQQCMRAAGTSFFFTWFPRFLRETRGLDEVAAGQFALWPLLAGMCGGFCGGVFSDALLRFTGSLRIARQGMACAVLFSCAAVALLAYNAAEIGHAIALLCVGVFFAQSCGACGYSVAIAYGGKRVAIVFATMNMSGNIGAALFPMFIGILVDRTGNWNYALLVFAWLFVASGACWAFLKAKGTLFDDDLAAVRDDAIMAEKDKGN
jgi:MFS family permease